MSIDTRQAQFDAGELITQREVVSGVALAVDLQFMKALLFICFTERILEEF